MRTQAHALEQNPSATYIEFGKFCFGNSEASSDGLVLHLTESTLTVLLIG